MLPRPCLQNKSFSLSEHVDVTAFRSVGPSPSVTLAIVGLGVGLVAPRICDCGWWFVWVSACLCGPMCLPERMVWVVQGLAAWVFSGEEGWVVREWLDLTGWVPRRSWSSSAFRGRGGGCVAVWAARR